MRADGALDLFGEDLVDERGEFDIKSSKTDAGIVSRWFFWRRAGHAHQVIEPAGAVRAAAQ